MRVRVNIVLNDIRAIVPTHTVMINAYMYMSDEVTNIGDDNDTA